MPLCERPCGCPIEDLATDIEVNEFCQKFNLAKSLFRVSQLPDSQNRIFQELGLFDNESLWVELEILYAKWWGRQQPKNKK